MNWLNKRVNIKPALLVGVILALLLASAGIAYAVSVTNMTDTDVWPGQANIVTDTKLSVDSYELVYTDDLTQLDKVKVTVNNTDTVLHGVKVEVAAGTGSTWGTGSQTDNVGAGSTKVIEVDITPDVDLGSLDDLNIIVTRTS